MAAAVAVTASPLSSRFGDESGTKDPEKGSLTDVGGQHKQVIPYVDRIIRAGEPRRARRAATYGVDRPRGTQGLPGSRSVIFDRQTSRLNDSRRHQDEKVLPSPNAATTQCEYW